MKLEVVNIEYNPTNGQFIIRVQTAEERLAETAFDTSIGSLPPIYAYKSGRMDGYTIELTDSFIRDVEKQKQDFEELVKQNPNTRIFTKTG